MTRPEVQVMNNSDGSVTVAYTINHEEMLRLTNIQMLEKTRDTVVEKLAEHVLNEKYPQLVAKLDMGAIVNLTLAKIAARTADEVQKR